MYSAVVDENINGIILSIRIKDFFCHQDLYSDFSIHNNRNVFSVMGRNGSGKSSIVSALVIGLGGRAASTFRGKNLQSFIKRGENAATIEIKIKNTQPQAYKHDVYGDSITIVRTINASGGSFKILSHSGERISTKKSDVDAIVLAHDIQVENPISVLNQDDARSFYGLEPHTKYGAFRRATNFAQTEEFYNRAQENCQKTYVILERKNDVKKYTWHSSSTKDVSNNLEELKKKFEIKAFRDLSKEYRKIKNMHDQMKTKEEIENETRQLRDELRWFDVENLEREVRNRDKECEDRRSACAKLAEELRATEEEHADNTLALESLGRSAARPAARRRELDAELREARAEAARAAERLRGERVRCAQLSARLRGRRDQAAALAEAIRNMESGRDDGGSCLEALERAKERAHAAVEESTARRDVAAHDERQARQQAVRAASDAENAHLELKADEKLLGRARTELRELEQHSAESLAVFGANMVKLCELVRSAEREGRFSAPPRGPVGNYLKVKSKEWAGALEHLIGSSMNHFCVNDPQDSRLLFEIMNRVYPAGRKPGVTCSAYLPRRHDVSRRRAAAPGATCALDALHVTDHVVANYLIDNLELETVLLVADHEDAVRLSSSAREVPANCSKVVTRDCTAYMPAPRYRIYGGVERVPRHLDTSTEDRARQVTAKIAELEASVAEKTSEAAHRLRQKDAAQRALDRAVKVLRALQARLRAQERDHEDAAEALQQHSTPQLTALKEEYECHAGIVTKLQEEIRELTDKEQIREEEKQKADVLVDRLEKEFDEVDGKCRSLEEEAERKRLNLGRSAAERIRRDRLHTEEADGLRRAEDELSRARKALEDGREGLGPRPPPSGELPEVLDRLRLLERQQEAAPDAAARRRLRHQLDDVTARRLRVRTELADVQALVDKIFRLTKKHQKLCYDVQKDIERHVGLKFTEKMLQRNYAGRLKLDHVEKKLELYIGEKSMNMLSGGERSYCTVALFMAMWECVELPFYFMDEFDVFMDESNRSAIWSMLVEFSKKRRGRQFVFLTQRSLPIDAGEIKIRRLDSAA